MSVLNQLSNPTKAVTDETVVVNDFERRIPYWSYRTVNYSIPERFLRYKEEIDEYLRHLFEGEIDDGNGDVLDNLILDMAMQAELSLEQQKIEHKDLITSFNIRAKSDKVAFENELMLLEEKLSENKRNQGRYVARMEENEFVIKRRRK